MLFYLLLTAHIKTYLAFLYLSEQVESVMSRSVSLKSHFVLNVDFETESVKNFSNCELSEISSYTEESFDVTYPAIGSSLNELSGVIIHKTE